jgi:hypothetical protein
LRRAAPFFGLGRSTIKAPDRPMLVETSAKSADFSRQDLFSGSKSA